MSKLKKIPDCDCSICRMPDDIGASLIKDAVKILEENDRRLYRDLLQPVLRILVRSSKLGAEPLGAGLGLGDRIIESCSVHVAAIVDAAWDVHHNKNVSSEDENG